MHLNTAKSKLVIDLLFKFVQERHPICFRCGRPLDRESFSIEHKKPWLHEKNAAALYFDLENVAFSHLGCNSKAARRPHAHIEIVHSYVTYSSGKCRCAVCLEAWRAYKMDNYDPVARARKYERRGT
jgi:hypothetical protein